MLKDKHMKSLRRLLLPILGIGFLVVIGCAVYTFNPKGQSEIKSINIERFENKTPEYGLADQMSDLVIDAFIADGNLKVVPLENADAVLSGVLTRYERKPYKYDQNDQVASYEVVIDFDITLKKPKTDSEIWREKMTQRGIYNVLASETGDVETEADGQQKAIKLLVEAIINKTTKGW
jgi:hypothetical protein